MDPVTTSENMESSLAQSTAGAVKGMIPALTPSHTTMTVATSLVGNDATLNCGLYKDMSRVSIFLALGKTQATRKGMRTETGNIESRGALPDSQPRCLPV